MLEQWNNTSIFHYFVMQRSNQNLIKIDYKFTINTKATFYDIISGFSIFGFLGSDRKRSESDFVRNCPKLSDMIS